MVGAVALRRVFEKREGLLSADAAKCGLRLEGPVGPGSSQGYPVVLHARQDRRRQTCAAHRRGVEPRDKTVPITRSHVRAFSDGKVVARYGQVGAPMSAAAATIGATSTAKKPPKSSSWKNLAGLFPYLARYRGATALGMFALVVASIAQNVIPLATGVLTDILAGSARPFETSAQGRLLADSWLSRMIPYYSPHSRRALGIYCLLLIALVSLRDRKS